MLAGRIVKEQSDTARFTVDLTANSTLLSTYLTGEGGAVQWLGTETALSISAPAVTLGSGSWSTSPLPAVAPADPSPVTVKSATLIGGTALQLFVTSGTPGNTYTVTTVVTDTAGRQLTVEVGVQIAGQITLSPAPVPNATLALPIGGGTLLGPLYLFESPLTGMEAATKSYVDAAIGNGFIVTGAATFNAATFNAGITVGNGALGATAINSAAWLAHLGWLQVDANGSGVSWSNVTPGAPIALFNASVSGQAGGATSPSQFDFSIPSDTLDASAAANGFSGLALSMNVANGAKGIHSAATVQLNQSGTMTSGDLDGLNVWLNVTGAGGRNVIGFNPQVLIETGASGVTLAEPIEGNVGIATGVTGVAVRGGVTMFSAGAVHGGSADYGFMAGGVAGDIAWNTGFQVGRYDSPWAISPGGTLFGTQVQTNGASWTNSVAAYGLRINDVVYANAAIWTPGYQVGPDGTQYVGAGVIAPAATGLAIDATNYVGSSPTISMAGASYAGTDILYDETYGAIVSITVNGSGNLTSATFVRPPYAFGGAGTSTIALKGGSGDQTAVVGVTWTRETTLSLGTGATTAVTIGNSGAAVNIDGTLGAINLGVLGNITVNNKTLFRGHLNGLITSRDSVTPNTKIDISVGAAMDEISQAGFIVSSSTLIIDATTTGANGLDTGSLAAGAWYHVFVIGQPGGIVAGFMSTSTTPTLPSGYTLRRRIGSVETDGAAHFLPYNQTGNRFDRASPQLELTASPGATTAQILPLSGVPGGVVVEAILHGTIQDATAVNPILYVSSFGQTDVAASVTALTAIIGGPAGVSAIAGFSGVRVVTNTLGEIRYRPNSTTISINLASDGWIDTRGQLL